MLSHAKVESIIKALERPAFGIQYGPTFTQPVCWIFHGLEFYGACQLLLPGKIRRVYAAIFFEPAPPESTEHYLTRHGTLMIDILYQPPDFPPSQSLFIPLVGEEFG